MMFFIHEEFATFKANTSGYFYNFFYVLYKENGSRQFNVPEISGVYIGQSVGGAHRTVLVPPFWGQTVRL
jgi:hypothetical protein